MYNAIRKRAFLVSLDLPCHRCMTAVMREVTGRHITTDEFSNRTGEVWCQNKKQYASVTTWIASYLRANHPDPEGDHYVTE